MCNDETVIRDRKTLATIQSIKFEKDSTTSALHFFVLGNHILFSNVSR